MTGIQAALNISEMELARAEAFDGTVMTTLDILVQASISVQQLLVSVILLSYSVPITTIL